MFGDLVIDIPGYDVRRDGERIRLTYLEFQLLRVLSDRAGRVLKRDELVALAWTNRNPMSGRTVDIHVSRLRRKLGPSGHALIETIRSVGYKCMLPALEHRHDVNASVLDGRPAA